MNALMLAAPAIVFALVVLFGFTGCWLRTEGTGTGGTDGNGTENGNGEDTTPPYVEVVMGSGPIAYWRLSDPDQSDDATDHIGPHPGTYIGTVDLGIQPGLNLSDPGATPARFDTIGHVEVPQDVPFQTTVFSVEALVHPNKVDARGVVASNLSLSGVDNSTSSAGWALAVVPPPDPSNDGLFEALVADDSGVVIETAKFDFAGLGTAAHLAMTFDGTSLILYRDGAEVINVPVPAFTFNTQQPLKIGDGFQGAIQEVAVYDKVLTPTEVGDHFTANEPPGP